MQKKTRTAAATLTRASRASDAQERGSGFPTCDVSASNPNQLPFEIVAVRPCRSPHRCRSAASVATLLVTPMPPGGMLVMVSPTATQPLS